MQLVYQIYWVIIVRWWIKRQNLNELIDERLNAKSYEEQAKQEDEFGDATDQDLSEEKEIEESEDENMGD